MTLFIACQSALLPPVSCSWPNDDPRCNTTAYSGTYPACALFQYKDRRPIPCVGVEAETCKFTGTSTNSTPPRPASWHVHIFFPNPLCKDCDPNFTTERPGFTFNEAMEYRRDIAQKLNHLTEKITGTPPQDPIDVFQALGDPNYDQCIMTYNIVAGAPGNFHREPCIYEVDAVKEGGPFANPSTSLGYPNYSFFLPGEYWLPGLLPKFLDWLRLARTVLGYGAYAVLIHPNTGCETRDHMEEQSIRWLGQSFPLSPQVFSCDSVGCNQACPSSDPFPANCSHIPQKASKL